jgi:peptidoglycan/LPS O-acetylase OafA/YrhL
LINKKYILHSIIIIILVGVFSRAVFEFSPELLYRKGFYIFTTPTCLDAFGLGALLAYLNKNNLISNKIIRTIKISSWVSLIVFSLLIVFLKFPSPSQNIFYRFLISIISIQLILYFLNIQKLKVLFENNLLVYIGKISYSLYLFHNFIPIFYQRINSYLIIEGYKIPFTNYSWLPYVGGNIQMILYFVILLGLSTISWFIFEKPINSLKNKFTY